ncbi:MAG: DUF2510 domain-containing protein [Acidimicrobiales bacterium]
MTAVGGPPPSTEQAAPRSTRRRTWLIIMVVAVLVAILCGYQAVDRVRSFADAPTFRTPGHTTVQLGQGRYMLYELTAVKGLTSFGPSDVDIAGPNEQHIEARAVTGSQTITLSSDEYTGAAELSAPKAGSYTITVTGSSRGEVLIDRPVTDTLASVAKWGVPALLAGILALVALILVLVNPWARKQARALGPPIGSGWPAPPPSSAAPPGWYDDPWGAAPKRWWDGSTWSGHTSGETPSE